MITVFICDDDRRSLDVMSTCVSNHIAFEEYDMELALSTSEPNEVLACIRENSKLTGLYFLDVELGGNINGVELARMIRQYDPRGFVVFVTAHPHYMQTTFELQVEAMDFIRKSSDENEIRDRLCKCLRNAYEKHVSRSEESRFIFKSINGRQIACDYSDILYFQTDTNKDSKRIVLHTKKRPHRFYGTISGLSKVLPKGQFIKCHKSAIVNVASLSESCRDDLTLGKDYMVMSDGTDCSVAQRKRREMLRIMCSLFGKPFRDGSQVKKSPESLGFFGEMAAVR